MSLSIMVISLILLVLASVPIAFALGGFLGTVAIDVSRLITTDAALAYGVVFALEAALFVVAAAVGMRVRDAAQPGSDTKQPAAPLPSFTEVAMVEVLDGR